MQAGPSAPRTFCFNAVLLQSGEMDAAYVHFPFDVMECFGAKGLIKIDAVFDHQVNYRGSLANMGTGHHILIVLKRIRKQLNKQFGDQIHVCLKADLNERKVEIPPLVQDLFTTFPELEQGFHQLSFTRRKEMIAWILEAKKPETKEKRLAKMLQLIEEKMQTSKKKQSR